MQATRLMKDGTFGQRGTPQSSAQLVHRARRASLIRVAAPERPAERILLLEATKTEETWQSEGQLFEYTSAARPVLTPIPIDGFAGALHEAGPTRVIPCDLSHDLETPYPATAPNLLASFVRVCEGESIETVATATSQLFYVVRGSGVTRSEYGTVSWGAGDVLILPKTTQPVVHLAGEGGKTNGAAMYWVHDGPLLQYLGVEPAVQKFDPALFRKQDLVDTVMGIATDPVSKNRNRIGVLLSNKAMVSSTKTISHTLWALFNMLPPHSMQKPHKHSSTALDLAVVAPAGTYTMMAREIDGDGQLVDPIRVDWTTGGMFTTPPGYWHSHHNESDEPAWVFPVQDAGLFTHQRTLDIRFADQEMHNVQAGRSVGATFEGFNMKL